MTLRELITKIGFQVDERGADEAEKRVKKMSLGMKTAIGAVVAGVVALGVSALTAAGDMEMLTTQFEVMLGSTEAAVAMMDDLKTFAAETPFALEDLAVGTQQLLSFGVASEDVVETMKLLGDTAGGDAEKLSGLVLAYGKVTTKGKASLEEINMMAERGIPIFDVLSKQMGTSKEELFKLISAGKISSEAITESFRTMTSEGGMFFEGMKKQSLTFKGLVSTMKDNIKLMIAGIGKTLLPVAKQVVETITNLVKGPLGALAESLIKVLAPIIESVAGLLENVVTAIMPLGTILEAIMPLFATLLGLLDSLGPLLGVVGSLLSAIGEIIAVLMPPLNTLLTIIIDIINVIVEMVSAELLSMLEPLTEVLVSVAEIISSILTMLMPLIRIILKILSFGLVVQLKMFTTRIKLMLFFIKKWMSLLSGLYSLLASKLIPIFEKMERVFQIIAAIAKYFFGLLKDLIIETIVNLGILAKSIWDNIAVTIGNIVNKILEWVGVIKDTVKNIIIFISGLIGEFWNWLMELFPGLGKLINGIGSVFINMWQSVKDVFLGMWSKITEGIQQLIGWVNKIPGVELEIPGIEGLDAGPTATGREMADLLTGGNTPAFNPAITAAGKTANIDMQNNIQINVPDGSNTEAIKTAVEDTARAIFTIELQKMIVNTGI